MLLYNNPTDSPSTSQAMFDTFSQEEAEEWQWVIQFHLLVIESQGKSQGPKQVPAQTKSQNAP